MRSSQYHIRHSEEIEKNPVEKICVMCLFIIGLLNPFVFKLIRRSDSKIFECIRISMRLYSFSAVVDSADVSSGVALFIHFILQILKVQHYLGFLKSINSGCSIKTLMFQVIFYIIICHLLFSGWITNCCLLTVCLINIQGLLINLFPLSHTSQAEYVLNVQVLLCTK